MGFNRGSTSSYKRHIRLGALILMSALFIPFILTGCFSKKQELHVGDVITMGSYSGERIEWVVKVVDASGQKALVVSTCAIEAKMFSDDYSKAECSWESSSLRKWLNSEFYDQTFNDNEKERIIESSIKNGGNPELGVEASADTKDKIFLLSVDEVRTYFTSDEERKCPSSTAAQGRVNTIKGHCYWWLRTPGKTSNCTAFVAVDGYVNDIGDMLHDLYGVRPAMWISIE